MHWTLLAFSLLTGLTFFGTVVQWHLVRSVPLGFWVCAAWMVQQAYWRITGGDSQALFMLGDLVIIIMAWRVRARWQAWAIICLTMCSVAGWQVGGVFGWWWSTYCVMASMIVGLPWLERAIWRGPKRRTEYEVA